MCRCWTPMQEVVGAWSRECHVTGRAEGEDGALETLGRDVRSEGLLGRKRRRVGVVGTSGVELGCGLVRKPAALRCRYSWCATAKCTCFGRSELIDGRVGGGVVWAWSCPKEICLLCAVGCRWSGMSVGCGMGVVLSET